MSRLLAIETATEACSAALYLDGEVLERFQVAPRRHAELLLPMLDALLAEAGLDVRALDAVAFGRGPGAFTGVRIAAAAAQGIALGAGLPVVPVSTLAALAQGGLDATSLAAVAAAIDARMGEVYWCCYRRGEDGLAEPLQDECVIAPERVPVPADLPPCAGVGSGFAAHGEALARRLGERLRATDPQALPHAAAVARLAAAALARGETVPPAEALPVYLRDQVIQHPR